MKKLIVLLIITVVCLSAYSQGGFTKPNNSYGTISNRQSIDSTFFYPTGCGAPTLQGYNLKKAARYFDSCNHKDYFFDPKLNSWDTARGSHGTGTLAEVTAAGKRTPDTAIFGGVRTNYIVADTNSSPFYEFLIIPDIQNMTNTSGSVYLRPMFNWMRDSSAFYNVQFIGQVGDVVNNNTTLQWDTAVANINMLDPLNIPYLFVPGNHDYGSGFNPAGRDATLWNNSSYMGVARFSGKTWYGGHYSTGNENYWINFSVGTKKYMVVGLEFLPRDVVVSWASSLIDSMYASEPDREVMIITHAYITSFGERAVDSSVYSGATYGMSADNDGQELWDNLVKKKRSVRWVFSGHFLIPGQTAQPLTDHIVSVNDYGDLVNQIYIDYQDDTHGGNGYFMRLHFQPSEGKVRVNVWSPYLGQFDTRLTMPNRDSTAFTLSMPTISIASSTGVGGTVSVRDDFRVGGEFKNDALHKGGIPVVGDDHKLFDTLTALRYDFSTPKGTLGHGLNTDDIRVFSNGKVDLDTNAALVARPKRGSAVPINIGGTFDSTSSSEVSAISLAYNYTHYKGGGPHVSPYQSLRNYFLDSNRTVSIGSSETSPNGINYNYTEIFLDNNTTLASTEAIGVSNYWSRQQLRGGSSSTNRSHTTGLNIVGYGSQLFIVGFVDTLGSFTGFKDQLTSFSQANAVKTYYSFYTNNGYANHIRSWAFYNANNIQRNFFSGQTLIGDSSVANAGTNQLYVLGGVRVNSNGIGFNVDSGAHVRIRHKENLFDTAFSVGTASNVGLTVERTNDNEYFTTTINSLRSQNLATVVGIGTSITGGKLNFSGNSMIGPFQQPLDIVVSYPSIAGRGVKINNDTLSAQPLYPFPDSTDYNPLEIYYTNHNNGLPSLKFLVRGDGQVRILGMESSTNFGDSSVLVHNGFLQGTKNWGTYTPTATGIANYASSASLTGKWTVTGNIVDVTISGTFTATLGGSAVLFDLSLPSGLTSNFTSQQDAIGNGAAIFAGSNEAMLVLANTTDDRLAISTGTILSTSARDFTVTVKYEIK